MTPDKPDKETVIRLKEAQAKAALSDVVHEVETLEEGDCDTKMLEIVDEVVDSVEKRVREAKDGTGKVVEKK